MGSNNFKEDFAEHIKMFSTVDYQVPAVPIDKKYVHKKLAKNIAITKPEVLSEKGPILRSRIIVANENDFFFDHDLRHLPGMLLVEAIRQISVGLTHVYYNVPVGDRFVLNEISTRFYRLSNKRDPVYLDEIILKAMMKDNVARLIKGVCYVHQNDQLLAVASGSWSTITTEIFEKLEDEICREPYPSGVMVNAVGL